MAAKEKRGLGTGLGALFGNDSLLSEDESELQNLPIEKVEPRDDQPRIIFDEQALQELADSISTYGVIQPITVRKVNSGYYQIIAGERRWRASKLAGLREIPARIIEADDRKTAELALVENLQREDLNPIEEAKGYKRLIDEFSLTQDEISKNVGKSRPAIANAMRLLTLSESVIKMVESGDLSAGHARALVSVENAERQLEAANEIVKRSLSVRKAEQLAKKYTLPAPEEKVKTDEVDYAAEVSEMLGKKLGRRVILTEKKNAGKIEIEFYNPDDRENLINQLMSISLK